MVVLVWLLLILGAGCLLLATFKVNGQKVDLQPLGLLFWLAAVICMRVG
jgi:hypothetical protein